MPKLKISLFGETWKIKQLDIEDNLKEKISSICNLYEFTITEALLDLSFYELLNEPSINSVSDFKSNQIGGLRNTHKGLIEIWFNGKKIKRIKPIELFHPNTLFDLYHTSIIQASNDNLEEGIYITEYEIGLLGNYEKQIDKFSIDLMSFGLLNFKNQTQELEILSEVFYDKKLLISKREDLLVTRSECRVVA
jgi:hypothetical protein